ncbi:MAG: tetratricopeptide repeat protein [Thermincolia bacterium]
MNQGNTLKSFLEHKITFDPKASISIYKAAIILTSVTLVTLGAIWFLKGVLNPGPASYYDYRIEKLQQHLHNHPEDKAAVLELAMNLYLKGEEKRGIALVEEVLAKYPKNPEALFNLGLMLSDRGQYQESIKVLENLTQVKPGFEGAKVNFYLGRSYFEIENYWDSLRNLEQAVLRDPGYPVAYYYLGMTNEKLGNHNKAIKALQQGIYLAGTYPEAEKALRRLASQ